MRGQRLPPDAPAAGWLLLLPAGKNQLSGLSWCPWSEAGQESGCVCKALAHLRREVLPFPILARKRGAQEAPGNSLNVLHPPSPALERLGSKLAKTQEAGGNQDLSEGPGGVEERANERKEKEPKGAIFCKKPQDEATGLLRMKSTIEEAGESPVAPLLAKEGHKAEAGAPKGLPCM